MFISITIKHSQLFLLPLIESTQLTQSMHGFNPKPNVCHNSRPIYNSGHQGCDCMIV